MYKCSCMIPRAHILPKRFFCILQRAFSLSPLASRYTVYQYNTAWGIAQNFYFSEQCTFVSVRKRPILYGQRGLIAYRDDLVLAAFRKAANTFQSLCPYSAAVDSGSIEAGTVQTTRKRIPLRGEESDVWFPCAATAGQRPAWEAPGA